MTDAERLRPGLEAFEKAYEKVVYSIALLFFRQRITVSGMANGVIMSEFGNEDLRSATKKGKGGHVNYPPPK